jgi:hypothetical protein
MTERGALQIVLKNSGEAPFGRDGTGSLLESFRVAGEQEGGTPNLKVLSRRS